MGKQTQNPQSTSNKTIIRIHPHHFTSKAKTLNGTKMVDWLWPFYLVALKLRLPGAVSPPIPFGESKPDAFVYLGTPSPVPAVPFCRRLADA